MSKSELKDEHRNEEGDPHIRAKRRQIQRELAQKRKMIRELPKATVVITNPTHFAIALRYEKGETPAPVCIAKGKDHFALRLIEEAKKHGVPVIEDAAEALGQHDTAEQWRKAAQSAALRLDT